MPNYINEFGSIKSHGHAKAHCLAELVRTSQITRFDRKPLLAEYRSSGSNMLEFFWSKNLELSEINQIWSSCFNGFDRDRRSVKFDDTLLDAWLAAWSRKNKKSHSTIIDHDNALSIDAETSQDLSNYENEMLSLETEIPECW